MRRLIVVVLSFATALFGAGLGSAFALSIDVTFNFVQNQASGARLVFGAFIRPSGPPTTATATQGATTRALNFLPERLFPDDYVRSLPFDLSDLSLTGSWEINATRDLDSAAPAFTNSIANPQILPLVQNLQVIGEGTTPMVTWDLPDLSGFDVDRIRVRVRDIDAGDQFFQSATLPTTTTTFTIPGGVLSVGGNYSFRVLIEDTEPGFIENRSSTVSQVFTPTQPCTVTPLDLGVRFTSIQAALNAGGNNIRFTGTCNERVFIGRSGVTLQGNSGNPSLDVIQQQLTVAGSQQVSLQNFTVDGGSGVVIVDGAVVRMTGLTVANTTTFSILVARNSFATVDNSTIGPPSTFTGCTPVCIFENSGLRMTRTTVTGGSSVPAGGGTLGIFRNSVATLRGGNVITSTGSQAAVQIFGNATLRQDDPSLPFGGTSLGIDTFDGSLALQCGADSLCEVRNAQVNGNTRVDLHSVLRIGGPFGSDPTNIEFNGDITLSRGSTVAFFSPLVTVNGDVECTDKPRSTVSGTFSGTGEVRECEVFEVEDDEDDDEDDGDD